MKLDTGARCEPVVEPAKRRGGKPLTAESMFELERRNARELAQAYGEHNRSPLLELLRVKGGRA